MSNTNPILLFLASFGLVFIGNTISDNGYTALTDVVGSGLGFFGSIVLLYSLYLAVMWIVNRLRGKQPRTQSNKDQLGL